MIRLTCFVVVFGLAADVQAGDLKAGAFAQDVTPTKFPISVNGNMTDIQAKAANDPLHARCLVLDDGKTKLAIAVVDSCMLPRDLVEDAKAQANKLTGIPVDHMLISATHTHSAPTVTGVFQSEPDADYVKYLADEDRGGNQDGPRAPRAGSRRLRPRQGRVAALQPAVEARTGIDSARPVRQHDRQGANEPRQSGERAGRARRPGGSGPLAPVGSDGRWQAALPARELLAPLRRRQPGFVGRLLRRVRRPRQTARSRGFKGLRRHHVERHQRGREQHQLRRPGDQVRTGRAHQGGRGPRGEKDRRGVRQDRIQRRGYARRGRERPPTRCPQAERKGPRARPRDPRPRTRTRKC